MTKEELELMKREIRLAVKETVNGRFDPESSTYCMKEIKEHMAKIEPYLNAASGLGFIVKIMAIMAGAVAFVVLLKDHILLR